MVSDKRQSEKIKFLNSQSLNYKGVNLMPLSQIFIFELALGRLNKGVLNRIKKYSLDNYLKAFLSVKYITKGKKNKKIKYLFVNDVFNKSMISNMRAVTNIFNKEYLELVCDRRLFKENCLFLYKFFNPITFIVAHFKGLFLVIKNLKQIIVIAKEFKINSFLFILNLLESVFLLNCVENFFKKHQLIEKIVLNSDVHKLSRMIVLYANKNNIKSHVIQHGSTVLEYGYLPVYSDIVFTWGKLSNQWFVDRGTNNQQLVITGTPKTDFINSFNINKEGVKEIKNILLILNPIGDTEVKKLLIIIKDADLDKNFNLTIKLHPGSLDNKTEVEEFFGKTQTRICKEEDVHELIYENDILITTTSTVGNEAIVFYKPLVQININTIGIKMEYELFNCSHVVENHTELLELLKDRKKINSKIKNYALFIENYFYSIDGKSSTRIVNQIN